MKASRFMGNMTFAVEDLPVPQAGPGELVVRNTSRRALSVSLKRSDRAFPGGL